MQTKLQSFRERQKRIQKKESVIKRQVSERNSLVKRNHKKEFIIKRNILKFLLKHNHEFLLLLYLVNK